MNGSEWFSKEYPFKSFFYKTPAGLMHYIDEGSGDPVVFIHGNPSWSFQFRNIVKELSGTNRCIAPDLLGFGLSDKPEAWTYLPADHADILEGLLESLDLKKITMVVGDWGGPIGLSYAILHPDRIKNVVITNTWIWPVNNDLRFQVFSKMVGGPVGRWLIMRRNFFARDILKSAFGDKTKLTAAIHHHYLLPLENPKERKGTWIFPREIIGSSTWLYRLWSNIHLLKEKHVLILWGMKDIAFREKELNRWIQVFPGAEVVRLPDAGHLIAEEKPLEMIDALRKLLH